MTIHYSRKKLYKVYIFHYYMCEFSNDHPIKFLKKSNEAFRIFNCIRHTDNFNPKKLWKKLQKIYKLIKILKIKKMLKKIENSDCLHIEDCNGVGLLDKFDNCYHN